MLDHAQGGDHVASLYDHAVWAADCHKWLVSERLGYDAGFAAWCEWWLTYWPEFCRHRRLEHLRGERRWKEFDPATFGRFPKAATAADPLTDRILDRFVSGWENLDFTCWIQDGNLPRKQVIAVLEIVDINTSARLKPMLG